MSLWFSFSASVDTTLVKGPNTFDNWMIENQFSSMYQFIASCSTVLRRIQRLPLRKRVTTSCQYLPGVWKQEWQPLWHKLFQELLVSSVLVSPSFHFNSTTLLIILPKHRSDGLPLSSTLSETSQVESVFSHFYVPSSIHLCRLLAPRLQPNSITHSSPNIPHTSLSPPLYPEHTILHSSA